VDESSFEALIREALEAPFTGWDFSFLRSRSRVDPLPWSYSDVVGHLAGRASSMLDMGTGGGEVLSRLSHRAAFTVATEAWPPNVRVAARNLRPLGIPVVWDEAAADNFDNYGVGGRMPFRDGAFSLVSSRHEAFFAPEVARVLISGGTFVTQQLDRHSFDDFYVALDMEPPASPDSWLPRAIRQVEEAGLRTVRSEMAEEREYFDDVGALVYYLGKAVTWAVLGFDVDSCRPALRRLHDRMQEEPLRVRQRRFLLVAAKPAP
jgi:SAM-dependent methyltransferase